MPEPLRSPPEIARETLRRLALEKRPPTPDNFRALYAEISGTQIDEGFPERALRLIAASLPRESPESLRLAQNFENAVASRQWSTVKQAILTMCVRGEGMPTNWSNLIRELITQLDRPHKGWTAGRKRESLERVLSASANGQHLPARLQGLMHGWAQSPEDAANGIELAGPAPTVVMEAPQVLPAELIELLQYLLQAGVVPIAAEDPALVAEIQQLAAQLGNPFAPASANTLQERIRTLAHRLELRGEDDRAVRSALIALLRLIIDNISELIAEDTWLSGQIGLLKEAFQGTLDIRVLDEVERRLRDVIDKQGRLKRQLSDAQQRLKSMLAGFLDQLAEFSGSTEHYHAALERCAEEIAEADNIADLANVIEGILADTRNVRDTAQRSSDQLKSLREQVESANMQIARLQRELDETSELVRHDALTGTLNRKGLDEALERELGRARRKGSPVCIAMLDIDNFKQLNDTFGHKTGDEALRHLSEVIRNATRPQDLVGRYGGEEFLILLPETTLEDGIQAITRLQRELTKRFFLADNQRILITFSAGVASVRGDEDPYSAIDRADKAMYAAKRAGKNRVLVAT